MNQLDRAKFCQQLLHLFIFLSNILTSPKKLIWCSNYPNVHIHILCRWGSFTEDALFRLVSLKWNSLLQTTGFWKKTTCESKLKWSSLIKVVFNYRSTHRRHFIKKVFLRCSLSKRDLKVFSCVYCKRTAKNSYLKEDLRKAASIITQNTYTVQEILWILTIKARLRYSREKAVFNLIQY